MDMLDNYINGGITAAALCEMAIVFLLFIFTIERALTLLMFFQQEEYDGSRFVHWLHDKQAYDKSASIWFVTALIAATITQLRDLKDYAFIIPLLVIIGLIHGIVLSRKNRNVTKKPLVFTDRVRRIFITFILLITFGSFVGFGLVTLLPETSRLVIDASLDTLTNPIVSTSWQLVGNIALIILIVQIIPYTIIASTVILEPYEQRVKAKFRREAVEKFNSLKPIVIAITGSFGKTSTKHILQYILSAAKPTLATPGSVNTEMGITRIIREKLLQDHEYFIVEMGAYGPGSIARLCKLTPPDAGLITAVGTAHFERFKSLKTVARAKFELASAVAEKGGTVAVNTAGIDDKLLDMCLESIDANYLLVGEGHDICLKSSKQTPDGLELLICDHGEDVSLKVPLYGSHQADNIVLAAATARSLDIPWNIIKAGLRTMPQIKHRTEVSRSPDQPTVINDAYNSNPIGFEGALEALDATVAEGRRRILITPGMVELGDKHDSEHYRLGTISAAHADVILIITPERIPTFVQGVQDAKSDDTLIIFFDTQAEGEEWIKANWQAGDSILFENNLPDLYEADVHF